MKFFTSFKRSMMVIVFSIVSISTASANIIWDYSPDTTGASGPNNYSNQSGAQNFLELVTFTSGGTITGMDIFSGDFVGNVGDSVDIKIWSNMTGSLGFPIGAMPANPIVTLNEIISVVDIEGTSSFGGITRKFAAFTNAYSFTAGNYWIGMSGSGNTEIGQYGLSINAPGDGRMAFLTGDHINFITDDNIGDMSFRLHGTTNVPEPAPLALLGFGLLGLGIMRRRKV